MQTGGPGAGGRGITIDVESAGGVSSLRRKNPYQQTALSDFTKLSGAEVLLSAAPAAARAPAKPWRVVRPGSVPAPGAGVPATPRPAG